MIGVQHVAGIYLEGEHRPQKPRRVIAGVFICFRIDRISHLIEILAFGGVPQAVALRLNVIVFRPYHAGGEGRVVQRVVIALGVVFDRNFPVAVLLHLYPFQWFETADLRDVGRQLFAHAGKPSKTGADR